MIEYRPTRTSRVVTLPHRNSVLVMNMAQPRQARLWPKVDGIGLTPCGRATAAALGTNRPAIIAIRKLLAAAGRFPDDQPVNEPSTDG